MLRIQMMDTFAIFIDETRMEHMVKQSKKGLAFMHFLIIHHGQPVPNTKLLSTIWSEEKNANPENALKTLVSRLRVQLNQVSPGLGKCIVADRNAYHFECLPDMKIDFYELEDIFNEMDAQPDEERWMRLFKRMLELYTGELLESAGYDWVLPKALWMHNHFMEAVYHCVDILKRENNYEEVINVVRYALEIDSFDDRLHIEMMSALVRTNRSSEALAQYKHAIHLHYRYLNTPPSSEIVEFYRQIESADKNLDFNLDSIRADLIENEEKRGAFICEYAVFKEIFNLQIRNLERLGSTMFLGVIMVGSQNGRPMETMKQEKMMETLLEILKGNLRKGDTISRFNTMIVVLLLPTVNYATGRTVLERIRQLFYKAYPNSDTAISYRLSPLSSKGMGREFSEQLMKGEREEN